MKGERRRRWIAKAAPECSWCGIETVIGPAMGFRPHDTRTLDHRHVRSKGGSNNFYNMRVACLLCNNVRGDQGEPSFKIVCDTIIRPNRHDLPALVRALVEAEMPKRAMIVVGMMSRDAGERARIFQDAGGVNVLSNQRAVKREIMVLRDRFEAAFETMPLQDLQARLQALPEAAEQGLKGEERVRYRAERLAALEVLTRRYAAERRARRAEATTDESPEFAPSA